MTRAEGISRRAALAAGLATTALPALMRRSNAADAYTDIFYRNDSLRIEAYVYGPPGAGPFRLVLPRPLHLRCHRVFLEQRR